MEDIEYEDIQSSLANLESGSDSKSPPKSFRSRRMSMMGRAQMVQMQGQLPQVAYHARTHADASQAHTRSRGCARAITHRTLSSTWSGCLSLGRARQLLR